jgi:hypothetical protein
MGLSDYYCSIIILPTQKKQVNIRGGDTIESHAREADRYCTVKKKKN